MFPSAYVPTRLLGVVALLVALGGPRVHAQDLPEGFIDEPVITDLHNPTTIRFHPDGRIFVSEKSGRVLVFDGPDDLKPETFVDISDRVHDFWDRGLLSIALHPDFVNSPYVYLLYTLDARPGEDYPSWGDECPTPPGPTKQGCVVQGRLSRFRADGNHASGAEEVLIQNWCQQFPSHSLGNIAFGPDGALYVTAGEGASFKAIDYGQFGIPNNPCGDPPLSVGGAQSPPDAEGGALRAQDLRTLSDPVGLDGALLRVDPETGEGLPDNPLFGGGTDTDDRIIAYGLRNPFRFAIRPRIGDIWIGDVGLTSWEEIDVVSDPRDKVVENFGWPCYEGAERQPGFDQPDFTICENLYAQANAHTTPFYAYRRIDKIVDGDGCIEDAGSITALAFYDADNFPEEYSGALIFADYARNCIWAILADGSGRPDPKQRRILNNNATLPVDIVVGPDGYVYYIAYESNEIRRIRYLDNAPVARLTAAPLYGTIPLSVQFDANTSSDPNGDPLTYAWDFDGDSDFDDASSAMPAHTFTTSGSYNVRVRVSDSDGGSDTASVVIQAGNTPPVATIDMPASSQLWQVGEEISFSGHATDPEQGDMPAAALSWEIVVQHCTNPTVCHEHIVNGISGTASDTFTAPDHDYPSYLELRLTATDADGLTDTEIVAIHPATATFDVTSTPPGVTIALGSALQPTPFTWTGAIGSSYSISAPAFQRIDGVNYEFVSWSNGDAVTQEFTLPEGHTVLNATYALTCGNDQLQDGEQCDDGNFDDGDCCSPTCTYEAQDSACADDGNPCTLDVCNTAGVCTHAHNGNCTGLGAECDDDQDCESDHCVDAVCCDTACGDGAMGDCQSCSVATGAVTDGECAPVIAGTLCREAAGSCDVVELCDGASTACPDDAKVKDGRGCDNRLKCDGADECRAGACVPDVAPADCDDGDPCTADSCLDDGGCSATAIDDCCDGGECKRVKPDRRRAGAYGSRSVGSIVCSSSIPGAQRSHGWLFTALLFGAALIRRRRRP